MRDKRVDAFGAYPLRCARLGAQGFTPSGSVVQRVEECVRVFVYLQGCLSV